MGRVAELGSLGGNDPPRTAKHSEPKHNTMKTKTTRLQILLAVWLSASCGIAAVNDGLVAYYRFEGNVNDASGHGLNGTVGDANFEAGRCDLGLSTTGSLGSYVEVPHNDLLSSTQAMSISLWVKVRTFTNAFSCLVYKAADTPTGGGFTDRSYSIWLRSDGGVHFTSTHENASSQTICNSPGGGIQIGQFFHVVAVVDAPSQVMRVYVNSSLVASCPYGGTAIRYGTFPLRLGGPFFTLGDQSGLDGVLDAVHIYNRALTGSEISELFLADCPSAGPHLKIRVSQVKLCWDTVPDAFYQLQYRSTLTTNQWTQFQTNFVRGSGSDFCTNDVVTVGQPQRYYRVVVTNAPPQL